MEQIKDEQAIEIPLTYEYIQTGIQIHLLEGLKCSICMEYYKNPTTISCSHTFCKDCITKWQSPLCPICRVKYKQLKFSPIEPIMCSLVVKCVSKDCGWTGTRDSLLTHLKDGCLFTFLCNCNSLYKTSDKALHSNNCPEFEVTCDCKTLIKMKDYSQHILNHCKNYAVCCPATEYGCNWEGRKQHLDLHINQNCLWRDAYKTIQQLKQTIDSHTSKLSNPLDVYLKSEMIQFMGLDPYRNYSDNFHQRVRFILKTPEDLSSIGFKNMVGPADNIRMERFRSESLLELIPNEQDCNVRIDIHEEMGIIAISLARKISRFFIIPVKNKMSVNISKRNGQVVVQFINHHSNPSKSISQVFFATRKWTHYTLNVGGERPIDFFVELTGCFITHLHFKCSTNRKKKRGIKRKRPTVDNVPTHSSSESNQQIPIQNQIKCESLVNNNNNNEDEYDDDKPTLKEVFTNQSLVNLFTSFFTKWSNVETTISK